MVAGRSRESRARKRLLAFIDSFLHVGIDMKSGYPYSTEPVSTFARISLFLVREILVRYGPKDCHVRREGVRVLLGLACAGLG